MFKCYICEKDKKLSEEHIIPNALGGRLKSKILCVDCNSKFGYNIDTKLCNDLKFFCNFLNIKRENGEVQPIYQTMNGISVKRMPGGKIYSRKPEIEIKKDNLGINFCIKYVGEDALEYTTKKSIEIVKKYCKKNKLTKEQESNKIQEILKQIPKETEKIENPVCFFRFESLGGKSFLSAIKIAVNFYIFRNKDPIYIKNPIEIIKNQSLEYAKICNFFYLKDSYDSIYHTIVIVGDKEEKILYSIVSLFGTFSTFILLNDNYDGNYFNETYRYDLRNNSEKEYLFKDLIKKQEVKKILSSEILDMEENMKNITNSFNSFMKFFVVKDFTQGDLEKLSLILSEIILKEVKILSYNEEFLEKNAFVKKIENYVKTFFLEKKFFLYDTYISEISNSFVDQFYLKYVNVKLDFKVAYFISNEITDLILKKEKILLETLIEKTFLHVKKFNFLQEESFIKNIILEKISLLKENNIISLSD